MKHGTGAHLGLGEQTGLSSGRDGMKRFLANPRMFIVIQPSVTPYRVPKGSPFILSAMRCLPLYITKGDNSWPLPEKHAWTVI